MSRAGLTGINQRPSSRTGRKPLFLPANPTLDGTQNVTPGTQTPGGTPGGRRESVTTPRVPHMSVIGRNHVAIAAGESSFIRNPVTFVTSEICRVTSASEARARTGVSSLFTSPLDFGRAGAFFGERSVALNISLSLCGGGGGLLSANERRWPPPLRGRGYRVSNLVVFGTDRLQPAQYPLGDLSDPLKSVPTSLFGAVRHDPMMLRSVTNGETEGTP